MAYLGREATKAPLVTADIPTNSINSDHYVDASIDNAHIADDAIDSEHYATASIDTAHIGDDQVTADKLANSINTAIAANTAKVSFTPDAAQVFNDTGADVDFRIESDDNANMFFVDGEENRVGIGTATPESVMHIRRLGDDLNLDNDLKLEGATGNDGDYVGIGFSHSGGSNDGKAYIGFVRTGSYGVGDLVFINDGSADHNMPETTDEAMRIGKNKVLGIGTQTPTSSWTGGSLHLHGQGDATYPALRLERAGTGGGWIDRVWEQAISSDGTWFLQDTTRGASVITIALGGEVSADLNDTSDEALKENIQALESGALLKINSLRPVSFDWKKDGEGEGKASTVGFIAQEVEEIFPSEIRGENYVKAQFTEATYYIEDDELPEGKQVGDIKQEEVRTPGNIGKAINTIGIVAHLTKAVQELSAKNDALEVENTALKTRMDALEARVLALEG